LTNTYNKEYYQRNKHKWARDTEQKKQQHRELSKESRLRHKEARDSKSKEWAENNHARVLFNQTRRGARYRGLAWDLTPNDIVIPTHCPYLGIELTSTQGQGRIWSNASVDRIDNSKGYVKGNVEVISYMANSMKQHATPEQLVSFAKRVLSAHAKEVCCDVDPM
jgi:hypothetical protein